MSSTLGQKLRAAREQRGISISEVAEQTRISPLYLEAIDADNYKTLPGGIFNKGFVRSYAKYVGIDEQEAIQEYSRQVSSDEPVESERMKTYKPEVLTDDRAASSMLPTILFAAVILGLMTAGILFLVNYIQNRDTPPPVASNNTPTANNAAVPQTSNPEVVNTQIPSMNGLKVEFMAVGDAVSLMSVVDNGKGTEALISPGTPVVFEPKESLKLKYSKSRAEFAQLKVNGKQITLPSQPLNPKAATIEVELNQSNLAQVWQSGSFVSEPSAPAEESNTNTTVTPTAPRPTAKPVNTAVKPPTGTNTNSASAPPANVPTMTGRPPVRPAATPGADRPAGNTERPN